VIKLDVSSVRRALVGAVASALLFACSDGDKPLQPSADKPVASTSGPKPASSGVAEAAVAKLGIAGLTTRESSELSAHLGKLTAPCGEPITLAVCIAEARDCKPCVPAGKYLGKLVRLGLDGAQIKQVYDSRFDPKGVKQVDPGSAPTKGPDDAVVTIVEWADFQCPGCYAMKPWLELMVERFPGQVRLAFKHFPLSKHTQAKGAAQAAVAAHNQGKFWEMYDLLFAAQETNELGPQDLTAMAKKLKLDMEKFRADFSSKETIKSVEDDMKQAEDLGLDGTPFIWINGRLFQLGPTELEDWIAMDIELAGKTPAKPSDKYEELSKKLGIDAPAPEGSASAAPSAGPAPSASAPPAQPSAAPSGGAGK
jgi:protein-disulfide isomerase